jgi:hypothetical protein
MPVDVMLYGYTVVDADVELPVTDTHIGLDGSVFSTASLVNVFSC